MTPPLLAVEIEGASFRFGDKAAVDDISLVIPAGSIFGLLGPNGAGKTTTIRMLVTILRPAAGNIRVFGSDICRESAHVRRSIGYVPQALSADAGLTASENVALFARLYDVPRKRRRQRVADVLESTGLTEYANNLAGTLSGGLVRRLELAQALVSAPRLLILDEPTVGLDPIARKQLWETIAALPKELGTTVLLTTHYMEEADVLCDTVALMHRGRIQSTGSPSELKSQLAPDATLDDVFRHHAGDALSAGEGDIKSVRNSRHTARRLA